MIDCIKEKLNKIETINLNVQSSSLANLYENFLKMCPNLKTLRIRYNESLEFEWMRCKYPTLEHFTLYYWTQSLCQNLAIFFQQNTHLQSFETDHGILLTNSNTILNSEMKLDAFSILYKATFTYDLNNVCILLNKLHENGFYRRLAFGVISTLSYIPQSGANQISALRRLEKLFGHFEENINFPTIPSLKELRIWDWRHFNFEPLTESFPNLRQAHINGVRTDQLLPFIRRSAKLKELSIKVILFPFDTTECQLDLKTLNDERKKLPGACKLIIFVRENVYLKTKEATRNLYSNYELIEIKRIESIHYDQFLQRL